MSVANRILGRLDTALKKEEEQPSSTDIVETLRAETHRLNRQLKSVISQAKHNEEKLKRFQALEIQLIGSTSLSQFFETVLNQYRIEAQLDRVSLFLFDSEYECQRIVEEDPDLGRFSSNLVFAEQIKANKEYIATAKRTYLGPYRKQQHELLFKKDLDEDSSIAIIPIVYDDILIGSLNLASYKQERFITGTASDFLQRYAAIVAVCFHNVLTHERLKRVGLTDGLTGINNRRYFDQRLVEEITAAQRSKQPICALFFDMDRFKKINDTYGHQVGDTVLREVAGIIRRRLRANDVLARYGGEEFSAILTETPIDIAFEIAERIRKDISKHEFEINRKTPLKGTISIGIACLHPAPENVAAHDLGIQLLRIADENLYEAKRSGRNRVIAQRNE